MAQVGFPVHCPHAAVAPAFDVIESLASEDGARLQAMSAADHNIGDKLEKLERTEQASRQEAITSELLDVVTGSEAILARTDR